MVMDDWFVGVVLWKLIMGVRVWLLCCVVVRFDCCWFVFVDLVLVCEFVLSG